MKFTNIGIAAGEARDVQEPSSMEYHHMGTSRRRALTSHGERSRSKLHFKVGGTENLSNLVVNALVVNVLAVNSVSRGVSYTF